MGVVMTIMSPCRTRPTTLHSLRPSLCTGARTPWVCGLNAGCWKSGGCEVDGGTVRQMGAGRVRAALGCLRPVLSLQAEGGEICPSSAPRPGGES